MEDNSNSLLWNKLTKSEKQYFYNSVIDNNLDLFISYLSGNRYRKPYNIFEEVSEPVNGQYFIMLCIMEIGIL